MVNAVANASFHFFSLHGNFSLIQSRNSNSCTLGLAFSWVKLVPYDRVTRDREGNGWARISTSLYHGTLPQKLQHVVPTIDHKKSRARKKPFRI